MRLRIQFEKKGPARFTSHRDLMRIFERCFAAAGIPVSWSEGFHPHMRMSFGPPLKTGWESDAEFLDLHVEAPPGLLAEMCNRRLPDGLRIVHVALLPDSAPKLAADISAATYEIRLSTEDVMNTGVVSRTSEDRAGALRECVQRVTGDTGTPETPRVLDVVADENGENLGIRYTTTMLSGRVFAPGDVIAASFGEADVFRVPPVVRRVAQYVHRGGQYISPMEKGAFQKV